MTSDGETELFRIYWQFSDWKSLEDRFVNAVAVGEAVDWLMVDADGSQHTYSGIWRFSDSAGISGSRFTATGSQCCFSNDDGAWGGGSGTINGDGGYASTYWGVGNFNSGDSTTCASIYKNGQHVGTYANGKTFMYGIFDGAPTVGKNMYVYKLYIYTFQYLSMFVYVYAAIS